MFGTGASIEYFSRVFVARELSLLNMLSIFSNLYV